jgi:orotate phosphoribosyltransferase
MMVQVFKTEVAGRVAELLFESGAIKLSPEKPFTWSSGWKSPIYCDNRITLSFPAIRAYIKHQLADVVKTHFAGAELIAGVATAGIAQGALIADELQLPFCYVRSKPKGHGMENLIEGRALAGQKVVVIEDLVSTGGSSLKAAEALQDAGCEVLGMAAIFTYGFPLAEENFTAQNIPLLVLSDYSNLLNVALTTGKIGQSQMELLNQWRENPGAWTGF